jgi:hypothetical protein
LGRAGPRNFDEIVEHENELTVLEKGSRVHLKSVFEEDVPIGTNYDLKWDGESQQLSSSRVQPKRVFRDEAPMGTSDDRRSQYLGDKVKVKTSSTLYGEW